MSKRASIITIFLVFILIVAGFLYFYFSTNGTPTTNPTSPTDTNLPFGNSPTETPSDTNTDTTGDTGQNTNTDNTIKNTAQLKQIYDKPISGVVFTKTKDEKTPLRFIDRATGNAYEYIPNSDKEIATRITNTTIPKIQEAVWSPTGENLVLRYLDDNNNISSFLGKIKLSTSTGDTIGEINGSFLPSNIKQLAINPAGTKIFEVIEKSDRSGSYGVMLSIDGSGKKEIFNSKLSHLNISWPKDNIIAFTTKPSSITSGFLFFFNTQTSSLEKILGNISGLSTLTNKDTSMVAYSKSQSGSFILDIYDVKKKESRGVQIPALADKCVWGIKDANILYCAVSKDVIADYYPDAWYQGTKTFSDDIWSINATTGATKLVYEINKERNTPMDVLDIKISSDDKYISLTDKNDLSLWILKIVTE